jgi:DNA-binding transcriptional MerR regulator
MTIHTIQEASRRSGLSEPTLRYYEEVGLVGPIDRDENSGHRRYRAEDLDVLEALACLRAVESLRDLGLWAASADLHDKAAPADT